MFKDMGMADRNELVVTITPLLLCLCHLYICLISCIDRLQSFDTRLSFHRGNICRVDIRLPFYIALHNLTIILHYYADRGIGSKAENKKHIPNIVHYASITIYTNQALSKRVYVWKACFIRFPI